MITIPNVTAVVLMPEKGSLRIKESAEFPVKDGKPVIGPRVRFLEPVGAVAKRLGISKAKASVLRREQPQLCLLTEPPTKKAA